jgi:hypothetical protein
MTTMSREFKQRLAHSRGAVDQPIGMIVGCSDAAMTEILGLDRGRARAWTLVRVLQNCLWDLDDARPLSAVQLGIAGILLRR